MTSSCQRVTCGDNAPQPAVSERLCTEHAQCSPSQGGFECVCTEGYSGDGEALCTNDDDCFYNDGDGQSRLLVIGYLCSIITHTQTHRYTHTYTHT